MIWFAPEEENLRYVKLAAPCTETGKTYDTVIIFLMFCRICPRLPTTNLLTRGYCSRSSSSSSSASSTLTSGTSAARPPTSRSLCSEDDDCRVATGLEGTEGGPSVRLTLGARAGRNSLGFCYRSIKSAPIIKVGSRQIHPRSEPCGASDAVEKKRFVTSYGDLQI